MKPKRQYKNPKIEVIKIDIQISMQYTSNPNPVGEATGDYWI